MKTIFDQFDDNTVPDPNSGCLLWTAAWNRDGYGRISLRGKSWPVHRIAYELFKGAQIPEGALVCHTCDTRCCVNPDHLFLGTYKDNAIDARDKGRHFIGEASPRARLNEEDVREIKERKEDRIVLAERYGVSVGHIQKIQIGLAWRHIT